MVKNDSIKMIHFIHSIGETHKFLFSKFKLFFVVSIISGMLGVLYAWLKKPVYVSEISFVTENENSQLKGYASIAAQFGYDLGTNNNGAFEGDNIIEFLKSKNNIINTLLSNAPESPQLFIDLYLRYNKIDLTSKKILREGKINFTKDRNQNTRVEDSLLNEVAIEILKSQLTITRKDKKLNFIDLKFKSYDESFSKNFSELLIKNTIISYLDYKQKKAKQNILIIQKQTDSVRAILSGNISAINETTDLNINPQKLQVRTPIQNKQIDLQVNSALYTELVKNLEISKLTMRKETPLIQIIDNSQYPLFKIKPGRLITGLLFSIAGIVFCACFLLTKRWYRNQINSMMPNV
jgi:uncharacterized protein involved in exopolysaccharide biosynthesis